MSDTDQEPKKVLSLGGKGKLSLNKTVDAGQVRQSFSHGRSKQVQVEVRKKRTISTQPAAKDATKDFGGLTDAEREARKRVLENAAQATETESKLPPPPKQAPRKVEPAQAEPEEAVEGAPVADASVAEEAAAEAVVDEASQPQPKKVLTPEERRQQEMAALEEIQKSEEQKKAEAAARLKAEQEERQKREAQDDKSRKPKDKNDDAVVAPDANKLAEASAALSEDEETKRRGKPKAAVPAKTPAAPKGRAGERARRSGKLTIGDALTRGDGEERVRSLASVKRQRERERQRQAAQQSDRHKVVRDVVIPEAITVGELANRMAERGADVVKSLMKMGVMATITQTIDADTAELVVQEFGHNLQRVSEGDVEVGLELIEAPDDATSGRPPVVTIMGHVDHGKTSLLDALRETDVVAKEAGGITQHIGAYQVQVPSGDKITFIDTPGHAAFTAMRARGADVTDIVILVVAADDGIKAQTVEAINHAKAAKKPIIVAINKMDKPGAEPDRVRTELLQHDLQVESMGGEIIDVEVSALQKTNLDKLLEMILLQAEIMDLKANPDRAAHGRIVEAKVEKGRGSVATVLVQTGTLRTGDIFIAGAEWGRVRALINDRGDNVDSAGPTEPVEVLGLQGTPSAGDDFVVVENEARAREVSEFRQRRLRDQQHKAAARGTLEQMMSQLKEGEKGTLPVVLKADVQGSAEAIQASLEKLATDEVQVQILHSGVGGINESDITLAKATNAMVVGFNVRANPQAREMAKREGVELRYYSIIYDVVDDAKAALSGMLTPDVRETHIGDAEIREVFNITKVGKVAGCMVVNGEVKRGSKVRLLRDDVVIHEGTLKTLRRFKDEVREVQKGYECGMAFENYSDIQVGDYIECFDVEEVKRQL
ncbi:MAG: translation initiation factor IF-2 [Alphaproteobacteria bacterium]|nr:translation initiation factor IF-2 [Alphaproteobacteria bacterium]